MSLSESYKLSQRIVQNEKQLERLLAILASSDAEQAKRDQIVEISPAKDYSALSAFKRQIEILKNLWDKYQQPKFTKSDQMGFIESHKSLMNEVKTLREREFYLATGRAPVINNSVAKYSNSAPAFIDLNSGASKGLDPTTGNYNVTLKYSKEIVYSDFSTHICRSIVTKTPNIFTTVKNLMKESESRGLTRIQFGKLLLEFIKKEYPNQSVHLTVHEDNLEQILHIIYGLIKSFKNLETISKAIASFKRLPEESIATTYSNLCALYRELLSAKRPFDSAEKIQTAADNYCKKTLKDLVNADISKEVSAYISSSEAVGETVTIEEVIDFISTLEAKAENQIVAERSLNNKSLNLIALNNNIIANRNNDIFDQMRNSRKDSWAQKPEDNKYGRVPTPRRDSNRENHDESSQNKAPNKLNPSLRKQKRNESKSQSRSRSRSKSNGRSADNNRHNFKQCAICALPECNNRDLHLGACPNLPNVRYNDRNFCDLCYLIGHHSCGTPCLELTKKRLQRLQNNSKN